MKDLPRRPQRKLVQGSRVRMSSAREKAKNLSMILARLCGNSPPRARVLLTAGLGILVFLVVLIMQRLYYDRLSLSLFQRPKTTIGIKEFYNPKPAPTRQQLDDFFIFDPKNQETVSLNPLWTCHNSTSRDHSRLVFLHVPRTGGSTIRALLKAYAAFCHTSMAVIANCIDLRYMGGGALWRNSKTSVMAAQQCYMDYLANATGQSVLDPNVWTHYGPTFSSDSLGNLNIKISAGQLPIGTDEASKDDSISVSRTQHVLFFRSPLYKFVSEELFRNRDSHRWTIEEATETIKQRASAGLKAGLYHDKYSNFLITPRQKAWVEDNEVFWTPDRRLNLSLSNLDQSNVVVGLTENMAQSLQLLEFLLDGNHEASALFQFFSNDEKVAAVSQMRHRNQTRAIVARIQTDTDALHILEDYLQYETKIYQYAEAIHEKQYMLLQQQLQ